jgi:cytidylate kinase
MPVITISRQFGAAGVPIGRALADRFGAEFLDRALVEQVALRAGIPQEQLESYDERLPGLWQRVASALATSSVEIEMPAVPFSDQPPPTTTHERLIAITRSVVEEAAQRGNAVILGRGAVFILGKHPGMLHVQLHAEIEARVRYLLSRVERVPAEAQLPDADFPAAAKPTEKSMRELCHSVDAERADYIRRVFGANWLDATHYDVSLDTGRLGVARTIDIIEEIARGMAADA